MPIYMVADGYPRDGGEAPQWLTGKCKPDLSASSNAGGQGEEEKMVVALTLGELLPMSFGPDQLL